MADGFVADDRTGMVLLSALYDPDVPTTENAEYVAKAKQVMGAQEGVMEQGPEGFGKLADRMRELGEDPDEILARAREREAWTR